MTLKLDIEFTDKETALVNLMGEGGGIHAECVALLKEYQANPSMQLNHAQYGILKTMKRNASYKVAMDA